MASPDMAQNGARRTEEGRGARGLTCAPTAAAAVFSACVSSGAYRQWERLQGSSRGRSTAPGQQRGNTGPDQRWGRVTLASEGRASHGGSVPSAELPLLAPSPRLAVSLISPLPQTTAITPSCSLLPLEMIQDPLTTTTFPDFDSPQGGYTLDEAYWEVRLTRERPPSALTPFHRPSSKAQETLWTTFFGDLISWALFACLVIQV